MAKDYYIGFRITEEMKDAIEKAAKDDDRTISNWAILALRNHLRESGHWTNH